MATDLKKIAAMAELTISEEVNTENNQEMSSILISNIALKKHVEKIENMVKCLCDLFSDKLLTENNIPHKDIVWEINENEVVGTFSDNKLVIDLNQRSIDLSKVVHTNLYAQLDVTQGENTNNSESLPELYPPLFEKKQDDVEDIWNKSAKDDLAAYIAQAKESGVEELYIVSDSSVCFSHYTQNSVKGKLIDRPITIDEFDELIDLILEEYRAEVDEDNTTVIFHFGGDA